MLSVRLRQDEGDLIGAKKLAYRRRCFLSRQLPEHIEVGIDEYRLQTRVLIGHHTLKL